MDELEYEAAVADAELQRCDGAVVRRPPLNIETNEEVVEMAAIDTVDIRDPLVDDGAGGGNGSED